ncbi:hypothetical protein [Streptomyces griseosporeus]|uniref:hypothetical protein n=1 Tax=Streptomyces griseosporeus TaxID=1910 RepID=UPI0037AC2114
MAMSGWGGHDGHDRHDGGEGHGGYGGHGGHGGHGGYGGYGAGGSGPAHGPSEESGRAAWQTGQPDPPAWASAETQVGGVYPAAWTPPPLPPSPPPSGPVGRSRTRGLLTALAVAAVLGVGAGGGAWYLTRDDTPATATAPTPATPSASPRAATPPVPPTSPSPSQSPSRRSGYRHAQDPVGYALDVPEGWTRRQKQGEKAPVVFYDSPGDGRQLQIFALSEPTPADSLDLAENDPGYGFSAQPGYRPLDRATGAGWAELTYRYDDADKGARQVVDHRFRAADGTLYAIRAAGPEDVPLARVRAPLTAALASFCPQDAAECAS